MVMRCAVEGCQSNSAVDKVGYFSVPSIITRQDDEARELSTRRRSLWISRLGEEVDESKVTSNTRVCGKHFVSGKPARLRQQMSQDWLPTIGVYINYTQVDSESDGVLSLKNEPLSPIGCDVDVQMEDDADIKSDLEEYIIPDSSSIHDKCCQADFLGESMIGLDHFNKVVADNTMFRIQNNRLKAKICEFSEEELKCHDLKVEFYTGLPTFSTLKQVFEFVSSDVNFTFNSSLSKFQEFMVVMVWLRLDLEEEDLAYRFGVSQGMVSALINKWLRVMATSLKKCIHWHEREVLCSTMPDVFKAAFGSKLVIIIDCFEIPSPTTSSFLNTEALSNQAVKVLIVFSPQSTVSFLSKAWVSQESHEMMIEKYNILENLLPGDIVITNCPFNNSVGMFRTNLILPVFSKGRRLDRSEEIQAEIKIAKCFCYIERVSDLVRRKFKILQNPVPSDFFKTHGDDLGCLIDHIMTVCCALINIGHSKSDGNTLVFL